MTIELDEPTGERTPVLRRRTIGEVFTGVLVRTERRQIVKDGQPQTKPDGKPRNELVVHMLALPGCTMNAGLGEVEAPPAAGAAVRAILKGGGYGAWIEADNALKPRQVGDVITLTSEYGQAYDANTFAPSGDRLTDQAAIDAIPRGRSVGIYGSTTIRRAAAAEVAAVDQAEAAYLAWKAGDATVLDDQPGPGAVDAASIFA